MASSSAMTTRVGRVGLSGHEGSRWSTRGQFGRDAVEQRVLFALELAHGRAAATSAWRAWASAWRRASRASTSASGRLRHQRAQPHVLRFLLEEAELLLGDRELGPDALQAFADVDEAALEEGLRHRRGILEPGVLKRDASFGADTRNTVIRRIAAFLIPARRARAVAGRRPRGRRARGATR